VNNPKGLSTKSFVLNTGCVLKVCEILSFCKLMRRHLIVLEDLGNQVSLCGKWYLKPDIWELCWHKLFCLRKISKSGLEDVIVVFKRCSARDYW